MTAVRTVTLSCDRVGCTNTHRMTFEFVVRQRDIRETAEAAGWTRRGANDFCPVHKPEATATKYAVCPREGCGRTAPVREDGSLRRHRLVVSRGSYGLALGKTCVDPVTGEVHTRYPDLVVVETPAGPVSDSDVRALAVKALFEKFQCDAGRIAVDPVTVEEWPHLTAIKATGEGLFDWQKLTLGEIADCLAEAGLLAAPREPQ